MVDFTGGTWRSLIDGSEVSAIPDSVVDSLESGNLDRYDGDTSEFGVVSGGIDGDFAIEATDSTRNLIYSDDPVDGVIPTKGMEISFYGRSQFDFGDSVQAGIAFCLSGSSVSDMDGYHLEMGHGDGEWRLMRIDNGISNTTQILREDYPSAIDTGVWVEFVFTLHDGSGAEDEDTIEVTVFEIDQSTGDRVEEHDTHTVIDDNHLDNDEYFGWANGGSGNAEKFGDNYRIIDEI